MAVTTVRYRTIAIDASDETAIASFARRSLTLFSASASAQSFKGYPCTDDCSGHEAGYEWAERKDDTDPDDCAGNSNSFIEGCRAWAEEQAPQKTSDDPGDTGRRRAMSARGQVVRPVHHSE